ncbi:hypothetical protein [Bosea caraganae]|uniref:hypothetical protein n=1 Tax=Bosea caraganae TaxID=2763117 RepID=UPI0011C031CA|nr:hypothetical protein [Bosea caraganae]
MTRLVEMPVETPSMTIQTDDEFRAALARLQTLESATFETSYALEKLALQAAVAEYMARKEASAAPTGAI